MEIRIDALTKDVVSVPERVMVLLLFIVVIFGVRFHGLACFLWYGLSSAETIQSPPLPERCLPSASLSPLFLNVIIWTKSDLIGTICFLVL